MTTSQKPPWALPQDKDEALKLVKKLGFKDRDGLVVHKVEDDRVLVSDSEQGAYTIFTIFNESDRSVRIVEESGWPI